MSEPELDKLVKCIEALRYIGKFAMSGNKKPGQLKGEFRAIIQKSRDTLNNIGENYE